MMKSNEKYVSSARIWICRHASQVANKHSYRSQPKLMNITEIQ